MIRAVFEALAEFLWRIVRIMSIKVVKPKKEGFVSLPLHEGYGPLGDV